VPVVAETKFKEKSGREKSREGKISEGKYLGGKKKLQNSRREKS
jgi:hypothetical protein